ncbi:MAG: 30S ribosomal protein S16, partial [Sphingorhabdus sp.]
TKGEPGQKAKDRAEDKATKLAEAEEAAAAAAAAPAPEPVLEVLEVAAPDDTAAFVEETVAQEEPASDEAVPAGEAATEEKAEG